eukprot:scaffold106857_cov12-Tisochrysis_lutea.AAC.1
MQPAAGNSSRSAASDTETSGRAPPTLPAHSSMQGCVELAHSACRESASYLIENGHQVQRKQQTIDPN